MNFITTPITTKYEKIEINQTLYLNTKNMDPNLECPPLKRSLGLHKFLIAKKLIISELGSYLFRDVDVPNELFTWVATLYTGNRPFASYLLWRMGGGWFEERHYADGIIDVSPLNI